MLKLNRIPEKDQDNIVRRRHNKIAKGMMFTIARNRANPRRKRFSNKDLSDENTSLVVRGTTDILTGLNFLKVKKVCKCCGSKQGNTKYELTDMGRKKLIRLRKKEIIWKK